MVWWGGVAGSSITWPITSSELLLLKQHSTLNQPMCAPINQADHTTESSSKVSSSKENERKPYSKSCSPGKEKKKLKLEKWGRAFTLIRAHKHTHTHNHTVTPLTSTSLQKSSGQGYSPPDSESINRSKNYRISKLNIENIDTEQKT